jgi:hypothetical protein
LRGVDLWQALQRDRPHRGEQILLHASRGWFRKVIEAGQRHQRHCRVILLAVNRLRTGNAMRQQDPGRRNQDSPARIALTISCRRPSSDATDICLPSQMWRQDSDGLFHLDRLHALLTDSPYWMMPKLGYPFDRFRTYRRPAQMVARCTPDPISLHGSCADGMTTVAGPSSIPRKRSRPSSKRLRSSDPEGDRDPMSRTGRHHPDQATGHHGCRQTGDKAAPINALACGPAGRTATK